MARYADVVTAFIERRNRKVGTLTSAKEAYYIGDKLATDYVLLLHGNRICAWDGSRMYGTLAGWPTVTTRKWLNELCYQLHERVVDSMQLFGWSDLCPGMKLVKNCYFFQEKNEQYMRRAVSKIREATDSEMKCQGVGYILEELSDGKTSLDVNEWMRIQ